MYFWGHREWSEDMKPRLRQSEYVITYVTHIWGSAAKYAMRTVRLGKQVIALA